MTNPESRFIPSESRETNPPDLDQNPVLPNMAPPAGFAPPPAIELNLPRPRRRTRASAGTGESWSRLPWNRRCSRDGSSERGSTGRG